MCILSVFCEYFESIWAFYFSNFLWWEEFWKSRKCCWCRIWLYWLYCIWMQYCWWKLWDFWIWNESILALLCLSSPLAKTSGDNCWWNFWINATKCEFWLMVWIRTLTAMKYLVRGWTRIKMVGIEDLEIECRWD